MWQRFTERARKSVFYAQEEAVKLGENYVSTEHLLLGLTRESDSVAARLLDQMGVSTGRVRAEIERQVARGDARPGQDLQLTPRAKRVIDLAYDEARMLKNNYIGTEHLLLGLIREGDGLAGRVLAKLGVDLDRTRRHVLKLQGQADKEELLSLDDAVRLLGVSKATIYRLLNANALKGTKVGRQWRFRKADLLTYLERPNTVTGDVSAAARSADLEAVLATLREALGGTALTVELREALGAGAMTPEGDTDAAAKTEVLGNLFLEQAISQGASAIHLEPQPDGFVIRYRIGEALRGQLAIPYQLSAHLPDARQLLVLPFKQRAGLGTDVPQRPQEGRFTFQLRARYEFPPSAEIEPLDPDAAVRPLPDACLDEVLAAMLAAEGLAMHLTRGLPPLVRVNGQSWKALPHAALTDEDMQRCVYGALKGAQAKEYHDLGQVSFSYASGDSGRFQIRVYSENGRMAADVHPDKSYTVHVATLPTPHGEAVTVRIEEQAGGADEPQTLDALGLTSEDRLTVEGWLGRRSGLILALGPAGSGKSTFLRADLRRLARPERKILVVAPTWTDLPRDVTPVQAAATDGGGWDYAGALPALAAHDPDAVVVADLPDAETARRAVDLALQGCLVLAGREAGGLEEALNAIVSLTPGLSPAEGRGEEAPRPPITGEQENMPAPGREGVLLALSRALVGVVALRRARRLCPHCREQAPVAPDDPVLARLRRVSAEGGYGVPADAAFFRGRGCARCGQTGYRGSAGLFEVMPWSPVLADALLRAAPAAEMRARAVAAGMHTLAADGMRAAVGGETTLEEVVRAIA